MGKIRILPKYIVAKIAAGEVVSNPSDVVKELVENSIDAGATDIQIRLKSGGLSEITVIDNGEGMSKEDLHLCFKEHATSKMALEKDLEKISSLGFRGEALYSLCIAGDVEIKSKTAHSLEGNRALIKKGKLIESSTIGMPDGTSVSVYELFKEIPARQKFLKENEKELKSVKDFVIGISLTNQNTRFRLFHDGNLLYDLPPSESLANRMKDIFGKDFEKEFLVINNKEDHFEVSGYTSLPSFARKAAFSAYVFVNGRQVQSTVVSSAVKVAYSEIIEERKTPGYILFLKTPLDYVDVNVHPKKEKIHFLNDTSIFEFVFKSVRDTLQANDLTFVKEGFSGASDYMRTYLGELHDEFKLKAKSSTQDALQVHDLYLITQSENGILLVDQHAAHERVIYEKLLAMYEEKNREVISLKPEIVLELSIQDAELLTGNLALFADLGIDINKVDNQKFEISTMPPLFENRNIKVIILELLDDLQNLNRKELIDSRGMLALSYLACRTAVKSGDKLTSAQAASLIGELKKTKTQYKLN